MNNDTIQTNKEEAIIRSKGLIEIKKKYNQKTIQNGPNILQKEVNKLLLSIDKLVNDNNKLLTESVELDSQIQNNKKILDELEGSANKTNKKRVRFKNNINIREYNPNEILRPINKPSNVSKIKSFLDNIFDRNKGVNKVAPLASSFSEIGAGDNKSSKKQNGLPNTSNKPITGFLSRLLYKEKRPSNGIYIF
jgi:hypothetical protein